MGGLLHGSWISLLLFADDGILISHVIASLQSLFEALEIFSSQQGLEVNHSKIKVMAFNILKVTLDQI